MVVAVLFALYTAIAKNLRGVVLLDVSEDWVVDLLRWLAKRFKYRDLGFTPRMVARLKAYDEKLRRPFRELTYPSSSFENLVEILSSRLRIPSELSELLVFSSMYISPAILIGESYKPCIESLSCSIVRTGRSLTVRDWKLHLRIAGYTILDLYEDSVREALEAMKRGVYTSLIDRRRKIDRDTRRYWRITDTEGRPIVYYVDNLELAFKAGIREGEADWAAALSIITIVNLNHELIHNKD
ncbi:MAG: hypothetical protein QW695_03740 [Candidatus Bathyarchaeia archaeon]